MTYELEIAEAAHDDITRNAVWWAEHHSYDQAIRWRDAIYAQMESLRQLPERHTFAAENPQFKYDLREKLVGLGNQRGYRVLFTIREQRVYVLAIHRAAQDTIHPDDLPAVPGDQ
jgi:plasmid stabilization system protein ParE